jgi:hypothetical protein
MSVLKLDYIIVCIEITDVTEDELRVLEAQIKKRMGSEVKISGAGTLGPRSDPSRYWAHVTFTPEDGVPDRFVPDEITRLVSDLSEPPS